MCQTIWPAVMQPEPPDEVPVTQYWRVLQVISLSLLKWASFTAAVAIIS